MNIVISGASSGIGYETVKALAKSGNHKIFAIARSANKLQHLSKAVINTNPNTEIGFLSFDLNTIEFAELEQAMADFFQFKQAQYIDILINNAGYLVNKPLIESSWDDWQESFQVNAYSAFALSKVLFPYFSKTELTHIVNIGSMAGVQGMEKFNGLGFYSASKAAINSLTESMAGEWRKYNIHTNCINPGSVSTDMLAKAFPGFEAPVTSEEFGQFVADFALSNGKIMNGRLISASLRN